MFWIWRNALMDERAAALAEVLPAMGRLESFLGYSNGLTDKGKEGLAMAAKASGAKNIKV